MWKATRLSSARLSVRPAKLIEIRDIFALSDDRSLQCELLLVKFSAWETKRSAIREVSNIYGADDSMIVELTGAPAKIDAFLEVIGEYDIVEMCRTGITAIKRGIRK